MTVARRTCDSRALKRATPHALPRPRAPSSAAAHGPSFTCSRSPEPRIHPDLHAQLRQALAGRYRVDGEIGAGGMAVVFRAFDLRHEREVAIKVLRPELAPTVGTVRFLQEVRIAAGLTNPHILTLIDSGEAEGLLYYVMPFLAGESLRARLDRRALR